MRVDTLTPRASTVNFDDLDKPLENKVPSKHTFLKSRRCKILVFIGILMIMSFIALLATTYTIAFTASTTTSSTTLSTTHIQSYQRITNSGDSITAIYDASVGVSSLNSISGYGVGQYSPGQGPDACIDFANTTYLNFGNVGQNLSSVSSTAGVGTGVHTVPLVGPSILLSIQFQTGNNTSARDPITITLEGSNATGTSLYSGSVWTSLYNGPTGLTPLIATRLAWGELQNFTNTESFTAYRMIVTSQRGIDYCTEFAEMHLYGIV